MSRIEEIRLALPHIELAAHVYGPEDGRPVIALHGWMDNLMSFARLIPRLQGLRIVALDLAGHGLSAHRPAGSFYSLWENAHDVLAVAEQFGWQRFSLLGHSMGAVVATLLAGAMPQRIERLAVIDGLIPQPAPAEGAPEGLAAALEASLLQGQRRRRVHGSFAAAVEARMGGKVPVGREAAELLAQRGVTPVPGGYQWRTDPRLALPSPLRFDLPQALAFARRIGCPVSLVLPEQGMLLRHQEVATLLGSFPFELNRLPGRHHLHLEDEHGAAAVADCFNRFFHPT